ncbi:MAG: PAS domain S-box protein [Paludibacter sp.]
MDYQEKTKDELLKELLLLKAENERLKSAPNAAYNETENIHQSELRYERFFEDNHSTMLLINPDTGEIKDANPAACQFYGWTQAEMQKMNIADINTLSMQEIKAEMQNSISDKGRQFFFKHRLANAEVRDVEVYSGPIIFDNVTYLYSIIHDISDIKHAEEKLRLNEERYRNIFETVQDAYYEATPDGILLDVSPSIETISRGQLTRDELIGKSMVGIYADPEARAKLYSQLLSLGKVIDYELMLLNKDGSVVPVAISTTIIKDAEGNPLKFTGSMRDISERKLVEDKIRQNEEKYRKDLLLLNSIFESPVNIIVFSLDTNYCYTAFTKYHAQTMKHIWGIDIQVGTNMLNMISVLEDRNKAKHNFDRVFNGENFVLTEEYGDDVLYRTYYENYYSPVKNSLGEISGVSVFVIDATERMQTTKSLEHSEERFSQVVAQSHEVVWELNTEGLYTYISPIASEIYGYSPEEMIGKMFYYDFLKVDQRDILKKRAIEFFQQNDIYYNFISTIEKKDGAERILSSNGIKLSNEKGEWLGFRGISADITDKLIAEEELAKFHTIADQAYYGAAITSLDGNFLYVNNAFSNMMGWEENELLGKSINVVHNQDQSQRVAEILDILRTNGGFTYEEVDHTRKDGSIFPTLMTAKVILDKNNKPEFVSTNVIDISDRKQAEETLIQKSAILTNLIINLKEGILLENAARQIELTNQLFCDMFGIPVPPDAMVGADCSDSAEQSKILFKNPDKFVADIHQILANKKAVFNDELELVDGRYFERDYIPTYLHDRYSGHLWKYRDITGKKLAEIELKKISQAVEQSPVMTIITNLAGNIEYVNPAFTKVTGYSRDELYGQNPRILSSGEKSKEDYRKLWKTISLGNEWHGEFHNKKKNGESYWAGAIISAIFDSKGKITHYVSVEENITHRKQIENELLDLNSNLEFKIKERTKLLFESEQKYKSVVESINEVIFQTDTEGLWLFLNPAWEKITGFTVDESIGKLFLDYIHPEDRQLITEIFEPLILRKEEYCRHEIRYLTKDGGFRWIDVFARLGLNDKDEIIATYGTLQDITKRKKAEANIEESREKYRGLSEASFESIFFSEKGVCIEQNLAAEKMFGYTTEEALTRYGTDWIVPEDREMVMNNMLSGTEKPYEATALRKDGTTFPCILMGRMMFYKGRNVRVTSLTDISERKQAETALLESEQRFSLFMDYLPALVFIKDNDSKMIYANNSMDTGLGVSQWMNKSLFDTFDPETAKRILSDDKKTLEAGYQIIEESFINLDGKLHDYQTQKFAIPRFGKEPLLGGILLDITDRKQAEKLVSQTKQNFETFFNTIDDFLFVLDEQGNIIHINETVTKRLEYSKEELVEKSVLLVHPTERREEAGRIVGEMLAGTADFCAVPLISKSGIRIPVETKVKAGFWDGQPVIFGVSKDMSKIQMSEEKFSKAFQSNSAAMAINSADDGIFIDINDTYVSTMGYSRDEIIGKTSIELNLFDSPDIRESIYNALKHNSKVIDFEIIVNKKSGEKITGLFSAEQIYLGDKLCLLSLFVNITDRKIAEEELRIARIEADRANKAKSEFLSSMSHELRTPLNSILGFAQLMEMGELNLNQKKGITHIKQSGAHLLQLINQVLDISRIESGRLNISIEPVQLNAVLNEMLDLIKPLAAGNKIHFELIDSPVNKLFVNADRQSLKQILLNLMNNAIKYNKEKGSVKIKTELKSGTNNETLVIRISIADSGVGIKSIDIPKLFTPFERIGSEKSDIEGTGLGLAVVKKLTEAMDGICGVESDFGKGSTFWIELPQANEYNIVEMLDNLTDTNPKLKEKQATVLYIEDNIPNIELVEEVLSSQRPLIRLITNIYGKQTVKLAIEFKPSIILLDLNLPDINGFEVLNQILDNPKTKDIPVVIISADGMQQQIDKLLKAGAKKYLTKPLEIREFLSTIDELI